MDDASVGPSARRAIYESGATVKGISKEAVQSTRSWEDLPIDCLVSIIQKVGLDDMIISIPFVCKNWHNATLDPSCWKVLDFHVIDLSPASSFLERFTNAYHVNRCTLRGFLKFVINRSHEQATKLIIPTSFFRFSDMVYVCKQYPKLNIVFGQSKYCPDLMRRFVLKLDEIILERAAKLVQS